MTEHVAPRPHIVLGYHGCDKRIGEGILGAAAEMAASNNGYDWLGTGYYFWENDPVRAIDWAVEAKKRHEAERRVSGNRVWDPYVFGAVIDLGKCLDLTNLKDVSLVRAGYKSYVQRLREAKRPIPKNAGGTEMKGRFLDFAIINHTCHEYWEISKINIDSVRAVFLEGKRLYPQAAFREKTHTQICVRRRDAILGYFRIEQPSIKAM